MTKAKFLFRQLIEIPDDWKIKELGILCKEKPTYGANVESIPRNESLPRYIRITDLNEDGTLNDKYTSILNDDAKPYLLHEGDFLFARTGATVGKTYRYRKEDGKCAFAGYLIQFKPNPEKLSIEFLFQYTKSHHYKRWLLSQITQGAQPNVNAEQYSKLPIILPCRIKEQEKIASILSNIDELILKQQQVIEQTQKLKKGQMQKLFSQGLDHDKPKEIQIKPRFIKYKIPTKWNVSDLKSVSKKIADIDHKMPNKTNFGVKFIAANNLNDDEIDFKNAELISESDYLAQSKKFNAEKNDILISRIGSIGVARKIRTNERFIASYSVALIKPKESIDSEFLHYYLNSTLPQKVMKAYTIVSGNVNLVLGALEKVPVLLPPTIEEQKKIGLILRNLDLLIQQEKQYKEKLEKIKRGLTQQLLTGKTRVKV